MYKERGGGVKRRECDSKEQKLHRISKSISDWPNKYLQVLFLFWHAEQRLVLKKKKDYHVYGLGRSAPAFLPIQFYHWIHRKPISHDRGVLTMTSVNPPFEGSNVQPLTSDLWKLDHLMTSSTCESFGQVSSQQDGMLRRDILTLRLYSLPSTVITYQISTILFR